jgi:hypothetical protein
MLKNMDNGVCDGIVMVLIGVSTCCVYGKDENNLFVKRNICKLSHDTLYVWQHFLNCSLMKKKHFLNSSYLYYLHTVVTDAFLFPIRTVICLLLRLRLL